MRSRFFAGGIHFCVSLLMASFAAFLVFYLWYPNPYREVSGGRELFLLVVAVDIIIGPVLTMIVFNQNKRWFELRRDLIFIGVIQIAALAYGLWSVCAARPVHMVFEYDRFRMVHAVDVDPQLLVHSPANVVVMPMTGPTLLALRPFKDAKESMEATMAALQGLTLASRPELWMPYGEATEMVLKEAKPTAILLQRFDSRSQEIQQALQGVGRSVQDVVYLPMAGRKSFWTVFLDPVTAEVLAIMDLDSF